MESMDRKHRSAVANHFAGKVREFGNHLRVVVEACDHSLTTYMLNQPHPGDSGVVYGFSAFSNAMQALKDALKTIGGPSLSLAEIAQLPHGEFMTKARNAATHDGNPIVNAWVDGRFFIATDISRFGINNEPIEIARPTQDVRTLCLQFAEGYSAALRERLHPMRGQFQIGGAPFDSAEFESMINNADLIPEHVKQIVASQRDCIRAAFEGAPPFDPIKKAITELESIMAYSSQELIT